MEKQKIYEVSNEYLKLKIIPYGATLVSLKVKTKEDGWLDVVLGHDQLENYLTYGQTYFGATIGPNANRMKNASFRLEEQTYQLENNEGENNLHSGSTGFHQAQWEVVTSESDRLILKHVSLKEKTGFPGRLETIITYELFDHKLSITFEGQSNQTTLFNPTNHSYFNLNGHGTGTIEEHRLTLKASSYTPVDEAFIPTGEIRKVEGTAFDFQQTKTIGVDINTEDEQLKLTGGYDHNYVLTTPSLSVPFAKVVGNQTGLQLAVSTNLLGVQFYTGNAIPKMIGKNGVYYASRSGFCLETQYYPDAINQENFVSPILEAGQTQSYTTIYAFSS